MKIKFIETTEDNSNVEGALAIFATHDDKGFVLTPPTEKLDQQTSGAIKRAANSSNFKGKFGEMVEILAPSGIKASRILLVGLGDREKFDGQQAEKVGGKIIVKLMYSGEKKLTVLAKQMRQRVHLGPF